MTARYRLSVNGYQGEGLKGCRREAAGYSPRRIRPSADRLLGREEGRQAAVRLYELLKWQEGLKFTKSVEKCHFLDRARELFTEHSG